MNRQNKPAEYFKRLRVGWHTCDHRGRIRLKSLCDILMEVAWEHAGLLGFGYGQLEKQKLAWILSRLSIQLDTYPLWQEKLTIHTWTSGLNGLFAIRHFELLNSGGQKIGRASTNWLVINIENKRPANPSFFNSFSHLFIPGPDGSPGGVEKLNFNQPANELRKYIVRYSDLDFNGHLTTSRYSGILMDSIPFEFLETNEVSIITLNFLKEALAGNALQIYTDNDFSEFVMHNNSSNKEITRAKISWRQVG